MDDSWLRLEGSACEGEPVESSLLILQPLWQPAPEGKPVDCSAGGSWRA